MGEWDEANDIHPAVGRPRHVASLKSANDSVAAKVLRLKYPIITESLSLQQPLPVALDESLDTAETRTPSPSCHLPSQCLWTNDASIQITCPIIAPIAILSGVSVVTISNDGKTIEALPTIDASKSRIGPPLWSKQIKDIIETRLGSILSLHVSSDPADGGRLLLGDEIGWGHIWRLSTGEALLDFPVASQALRARYGKNVTSTRLWVDHVAWSRDGEIVGAAAGRSIVLVAAQTGQILSSLESAAGTVTGIAFRNHSLAIASYGEVQWLTPNVDDTGPTATLKRGGAAIQCIDVSPNGTEVAVGFLDKTVRMFTINGGSSNLSQGAPPLVATNWVGFNAPVKSVRYSTKGKWLAAMAGSSILIVPSALDSKSEPPILCRTLGQTTSEGCDGTCKPFVSFTWSSLPHEENIIVALDASSDVHVFDVDMTNNAWPRRALPIFTLMAPPSRPSLLTMFSPPMQLSESSKNQTELNTMTGESTNARWTGILKYHSFE